MCHVSITSGTLTSDDEDYSSDSNLSHQPSMKRPSKAPIPSRLTQSRYGKAHAKVRAPLGKVHGQVHLMEYNSSPASSKRNSVLAYSLLISYNVPGKSHT